jgi:hypothetical protein
LVEWFGLGIDQLIAGEGSAAVDRASLLEMVLFVERASPAVIPFLEGETYIYLPDVLVPRFLNSNKIATQFGQNLLNIRYGLQTVEAASVTAIGWGTIAEGYANFGKIGVVLAGLLVGLIGGSLERWSIGKPVISLPVLASITAMMTFINLESDLIYLCSNLLQALTATAIFYFLFKASLGREKDRMMRAPRPR